MNTLLSAGLPGVLLLLVAGILFGQDRPARLPAMFLTFSGLLLLGVALIPGLDEAYLPNQIRLFMAFISLGHLFVTLETLRRNSLKEQYALLWLGTGVVLLILAIQPDLIGWLVSITGMHYSSAIMLVVFSFLILIAFHVSIILSRHEDDRRKFSQKIALLEQRIRELEEE